MASRKDKRGRVLEKGELQRKDGRYSYSYTDSIGKRHVIYDLTLVGLREKKKDLFILKWQGVDADRGRSLSLNDVFDRYMQTKFGLKTSTYASYCNMYTRYVRNEFGMNKIKSIKYSDIQALYTKMLREDNLSIKTVEYLNMLLHPAFELAIRDGILLKNPTQGICGQIKKTYGYSTRKRHALTEKQQNMFLQYIDGHPVWGRYHSIFQVMLGTGLRVGELAGLRWEDVDFEKRIISVNHGIVSVKPIPGKTKEHLHVSLPKTEAGIRTVPMVEAVLKGFAEEYIYAKERSFPSCEIDGYTDFIFTKENGNVYTSVRLDKVLRDIVTSYNKQECKLAEIEEREPEELPKFSCHILRHTFCTRLCERDVNMKVILILSIMFYTFNSYKEDSYAAIGRAA